MLIEINTPNQNYLYSYSELISCIGKRKKTISRILRKQGASILDVYHGEMRYGMEHQAKTAIQKVTKRILNSTISFAEKEGSLYSKSQPKILRELAIEKLYPQFLHTDLTLDIDEVIVCPYSSLIMLETALMTIAKPKGIILCPFGFYKSNALHIEKFDLELKCIKTNLEDDARLTPDELWANIHKYGDRLCGVLLTMPGNPLVPDYSHEELTAIGEVLAESGVKVIVDATFTGIYNYHQPLAAIQVRKNGKSYLLHNQTFTITGLSKGFQACGPYKIGVATSGDKYWLAKIKKKLVLSFQRETTILAKAVIKHTSLAYMLDNEKDMMKNLEQVKQYFHKINRYFGKNALQYLGSAKYGPFMLITLSEEILKKANIHDGWQLADMLLATVGINCVAGPRMGLTQACVRINVNAPRIGSKKNPQLVEDLFARLAQFIGLICHEGLNYMDALNAIGVKEKVAVN